MAVGRVLDVGVNGRVRGRHDVDRAEAWAGRVFERGQDVRRLLAAKLVPNRASTVLKRKFCDLMPIVLKASVTPTDVPFEIVVLSIVEWIDIVFVAVTTMLPPVAVRLLLLAKASAPPRMRLVAITPLTASEVPDFSDAATASAWLVTFAGMEFCSVAASSYASRAGDAGRSRCAALAPPRARRSALRCLQRPMHAVAGSG